uniref:Beta/gamma crystallin 'Greek key' domain-containing protein n=1 Tax=viral metagenome TaxID=1070528 RepID=A0A6C0DRB6_9ZZZZ
MRPLIGYLLILVVVTIGLIVYRHFGRVNEGFYPVTADRIALGESANRLYNDYADTQRPGQLSVVGAGPTGDDNLKKFLRSPAYEGDSNSQSLAAPNYHDEFRYRAPPELKDLLAKIAKCESVKSWDCSAFNDPEFQAYCGICTSGGTTHDNREQIGGLYIDPQAAAQGAAEEARTGKPYKYAPSTGFCKGEFIRKRPYCDTQKDRYECSTAQSFDDKAVQDKCALCVNATNPNTFVYINDRLGEAGAYALKSAKQIRFPLNLRLCFANTGGIEVVITDQDTQTVVSKINRANGFIGSSDTALITLPDCYEGKQFSVKVRLPQYRNYSLTSDDQQRLSEMTSPERAKLVRAMYGPNINDYTKDDERAVDVTNYIKSKFGMNDCSKFDVMASNDGLGGDPNPGIYKQLRLVYSNNGTDYAYAYATEGGVSKPVPSDNFNKLCPPNLPQAAAAQAVCERDGNGAPTNRTYVQGDISKYYGATAADTGSSGGKVVFYSQCNYAGKATELSVGDYPFQKLMATGYVNDTLQSVKVPPGLSVTLWEHDIGGGREVTLTESNACLIGINYMNTASSCRVTASRPGRCVERLPKTVQGLVGSWESVNGLVKRSLPVNNTVVSINGFSVGANGPPIQGTITGSKYHKSKPKSLIVGLPDYLFWFWARELEAAECTFVLSVPATLRDPTNIDDMKLCPSGPLVQTKEAAAKLRVSPCEQLVNGQPQGPGTYTLDCLKTVFLGSGCTADGSGIPTTAERGRSMSKDPMTGQNLVLDDIIAATDDIYSISKTGLYVDGTKAGSADFASASDKCLGKIVLDPCDTPNKQTGPHSQDCLDYLFRNAGKANAEIGTTYQGVSNRSSGSDRTTATPIMYCQRKGTMSPVGADGKPNIDAIQTANSFGGIGAVKEFYRQIHYDANFSSDATTQKVGLNQCYGVAINIKPPICKGVKTRYLMIRPSLTTNNAYIQISHLQAFDVNGTNVAYNQPTSSASSWEPASVASNAVKGKAELRTHPLGYTSATPNPNTEWWKVDFGKTVEIAYVVYYNRKDCCQDRSVGMRFQLLGEDLSVLKEKKLQGGAVETVMFSNAKPSGLVRLNSDITFTPSKYPGSVLSGQSTGEVLISKRQGINVDTTEFVISTPNNNTGGYFSFKHKTTDRWIRVQGFRVRLTADDGSGAFKSESSFKVIDSVAGNPGEISFESAISPGSYLGVSDNMGIYVGPATRGEQQRLASWRLPTT